MSESLSGFVGALTFFLLDAVFMALLVGLTIWLDPH
jgi:uncharacterized membrane protein YoaK (UPF0700 family)